MQKQRCSWSENDPLNQIYHDEEWCEPVHDDRMLFELLSLEGAEAGLSWIMILKRREFYRELFDNYVPEIVAQYTPEKIDTIVQDARIIRHRAKIVSTVNNAQAFLKVQAEFGSFDRYIWQFVNEKPIIHCFATYDDLPSETPESIAMSKALKKRGFTFAGSKVCYAFMQACGMVNDHTAECFKYPCR